MTSREDTTLYIERSKVREILIWHNKATQAALPKVDRLPIFTAADIAGVAQRKLGPCTQAEIDAFEGLDSKSKQLFSMWVDRALKAEAALAVPSTSRECPFCSRRVFEPCQSIAQAQNACTLSSTEHS